jgi:hypothetical protein
MRLATTPYQSDATYWLLVGMEEHGKRRYELLGIYINGRFEFRNEKAQSGYIYREDLPYSMMPASYIFSLLAK